MAENVLTDEPQSLDNSAKEKKKNSTRKVIATTTYFIAVLCLVAGLFVPLFNCAEGVPIQDRMLFRYLPSMFNKMCGRDLIPLGNYFLEFMPDVTGRFNFTALIGLIYAVVCVISLLMLIPILLASKKKNTSARCALGVEVLAMLVTLTYIASVVYTMVSNEELKWSADYNFLLAFGGSLLMAIIQTISSKGGIGVSKVIALLLSVIGVMAILDITLFIKELGEPLTKLSETVKSGPVGFLSLGEESILGIVGINMLIDIKSTISIFKELAGSKDGIMVIVIYVLLILIAVFVVLNLVSDVIGLSTGKKFKKDRSPCKNGPSNTFALVRYCLTIVFAAALIIMAFAIEKLELKAGIYLYLLVIVLLISLLNAAIRTAVDNARYKKGAVAPTEDGQQKMVLADPAFVPQKEEPYTAPVYEEPVYEEPVYEEPAHEEPALAEPAQEPEPVYEEPQYVEPDYMPETFASETEPEAEEVEPAPTVEPLSAPLEEPAEPTPTVYIYGGATDEFMDTLTDNEKVEFVELFLKKTKGKVNGVPDYQIDGDNSDFFPAVFVHINRYRNIVSDALMTKMYKQLGKQMQ